MTCILRRSVAAGFLLVLSGLAGCSLNPATGHRQLSFYSTSKEAALGREAHQQVLSSMPIYADPELQQYVTSIGQKLAASSEEPELPWTFTVLDDASVNAFALPGGYIYITRGILNYMTSEAQAAAVLGHEIGHVTGRHGVEQMSKAQLTGIGLLLGSIASPVFRQFGQLAQSGAELMFLKFGRDHEREADDLGLRYSTRAGYDPNEMVEMFRTLDQQSAQTERGRLPDWLSTHPNPGSRVERMRAAIDRGAAADAPGEVGRDRFLQALDGTVFGEDPRQGYFVENTFYHPAMRFQIEMPQGWQSLNTPQAVAALSPDRDAAIVLAVSPERSAEAAARRFFSQQGLQATASDTTRINGLPAVLVRFQAQAQGGVIDGLSSFIEQGGQVYQIVAYTSARRFAAHATAFGRAVASFAPLDDARRLGVQPMRIETIRLPRDMTLAEFQQRYPSNVPEETLRLINHVREDTTLQGGVRYKRVIGGVEPQ